eukprot:718616_1
MALRRLINRTLIVWSGIGFLCSKVVEGCTYNTDCTYTYIDWEDACFMVLMYDDDDEGFCYGGDCRKKNSYKDGCLNHGGNADNNFCVTNYCSSDTNVCEARNEECTICIQPAPEPTQKPTPEPTQKPTHKPTPLPTPNPTSPPTVKPTNRPIIAPTKAPTLIPSVDPTSSPINATVAPSKQGQKEFIDSPLPLYSAATLLAVCIVAIIVGWIIRHNRKAKHTRKHSELSLPLLKQSIAELLDEEKKLAIPIKNAMVILLAIGEYDESPKDPDQGLEDGLPNLDVDVDIRNLLELFGPNHLNYTIYPQYDLDKNVKIHWTEDEIVFLLKERAAHLEKHLKELDGLIVVISGHGFAGNICTSDCKWIEKIAIHRTFSQNHPLLRDLPRVFMFDCCDGKWDYSKGITPPRKPRNDKPRDQGLPTQDRKGSDQGKGYALLDVEEETKEPWTKDQKNPDHRLVEINAANRGFQSKLKRDEGSYMLSEFVQRTISNLNKGQHEFVYKVFDEIQQELAVNKRKQQITTVYNDRTRYIKLMPNRD